MKEASELKEPVVKEEKERANQLLHKKQDLRPEEMLSLLAAGVLEKNDDPMERLRERETFIAVGKNIADIESVRASLDDIVKKCPETVREVL